jgi:hypothetical protein
VAPFSMCIQWFLTFLLVHSQNDNHLVAANSDELLDTSDTASGELREENHAIDIVIFEEFDVGSHLRDLDAG